MKKIVFFALFFVSLCSLASSVVYLESSDNARNEYYPITHYFNAAFDVGQNPYFFSHRGYLKNHKVVFERIANPHRSIVDDGGYGEFFRKEFYGENVLPNIGLHLIGGGYDYRFMVEWFKVRNFSNPYIIALLTSYLGHLGNEAYEASNSRITSHDHIADLYFFDVVGKLLFLNDDVANFFVRDMGLRPWHFMPTYDVGEESITNAGLNYILRPKIFGEKVLPFMYLGMQVLGGFSFQLKKESYLTAAAGVAITEPFEKKYFYSGLLSYDIAGEPYMIFNVNGTEAYRYRVMLFPKFFQLPGDQRLGLILGSSRDNRPVLGIQYNLPLGIGYRFKK